MTDTAPNVLKELIAEYELRKKVREAALTPPSLSPSVEPPRQASLGQAWKNPANGEIYMAFLPSDATIKWVCMTDPHKSPIFVSTLLA
jgi:hypothetical protein